MNNRVAITALSVIGGLMLIAAVALSGCEGEPPHCPPPIGCAK